MHPNPTICHRTPEAELLDRLRINQALQIELTDIRWRLTLAALDIGLTWADLARALHDSELGVLLDFLADTATLDEPERTEAHLAAGLHPVDLDPAPADERGSR